MEKRTVYRFDWLTFIDRAVNGESTMQAASRSSLGDGRTDWTMSKDIYDAERLARTGEWMPPGAVALRNQLFAKVASMMDVEHTVYRDEPGWGFDVGEVVAGNPDHWLDSEYEQVDTDYGKVIRVHFNCATSGGVSTQSMVYKGAAIAVLVEMLELAGRKVEVTLVSANHCGGHELEHYVKVKDSAYPLDFSRLVYALAHPSVYRRFFFSLWEQEPAAVRKAHNITKGGGYGAVSNAVERGDINIDCSYGYGGEQEFSSPTSTIAWVVKQLHAQGIRMDE